MCRALYMLYIYVYSPQRQTVQTSKKETDRDRRPSVCQSVCLSVTRVDQSKTVVIRIMQLSAQSSPITLVFTARCYAERAVMPQYVVRLSLSLSVRPSVTFRYLDRIGWNSSKIISPPNSLRPMCGLTPTWSICCKGNTPKIRVE